MPSPPPFKIILYVTVEPDSTPETAKYIAGLFIGYDTTARWTLSGPTAAATRAKMEEFWERERKSYEPRTKPKKGEPAPGLDAPEPVSAVADDGEVL